MKTMEIPPEEKMGDLALPCFSMAKKMRKNPMQIAAELVENLNEQKAELGIEKVESVGAYCNIHLKRALFVKGALSRCKKTSTECRRLVAENGVYGLFIAKYCKELSCGTFAYNSNWKLFI